MQVLDQCPFVIEADEVLRRAGLDGVADGLECEVQALVTAARTVGKPKAVYDVVYVEEKTADSVRIGGVQFESRVLRINLEEVERVFPFVATCGTELDQLSVDNGDMLLGYCLDTIKEMALRRAAACLHDHLKSTYALGRTSTMSPGSLEDWPITQQRELFALLGDVAGLVGVRLTESLLMVPPKSVSGIVFPTEVAFESCQLCPRERCDSRRVAYAPELAARYGIPV